MQAIKHLATVFMVALTVPHFALAGQVSASYSDALTLSTLTEKVYQRLPGKIAEGSYSQLQQANETVSNALFADPATANIGHFNDAIGSSDGFQEWEGSVDMPLWLPGQKQAQQALSQKIIAQLPAYQQQLRLKASGEVRALIWQVKLAEARLEQAALIWETSKKLEQDVKNRVDAGDLPATEALLAGSNTLETHSAMVEAESVLDQKLKTYALITGEQTLPADASEPLSSNTSVDASHPQLAMQDQVIARLQAEMGLAKYDRAVNPNLSVGVRRERGDFDENFNHSLGLGISFALNDEHYSEPAIARASAAMAEAQVNRQDVERELNKTLLASRENLASSRQQLELMVDRHETTQEYYRLQKRAFDLGEINLIDLLRSQVLANETVSRKRELEVLIQQQIAEVNQALGIIL